MYPGTHECNAFAFLQCRVDDIVGKSDMLTKWDARLMTAPMNAWQSCAYSVIILNVVIFSKRSDPKPNSIFVRILTLYHCLYMSILKV